MNLLIGKGVRLSNDRNEVDLGVQAAHDFDVQRLERMTGRLDEVDTSVDTVVDNVHTVDLVLRIEVCVETLVNVLHDWPPGVVVVNKVTEARGVNDRESQADAVFFNVCADGLYGNSLGSKVERRLLALLWWVKRCVEESVDQSRLSETRFTYRL